jgi:hypothetical protein
LGNAAGIEVEAAGRLRNCRSSIGCGAFAVAGAPGKKEGEKKEMTLPPVA